MRVCYLAKVTGTVQGVYFRASAQQMAIDLAVSGHAQNKEDGSVEVLVCGEEGSVQNMLDWLEQGPDSAEVEDVDSEQVQWQDLNHFSIG